MNVHDYATRVARSDRATGKGTVARPKAEVLRELLAQIDDETNPLAIEAHALLATLEGEAR